MKDGDAWHSGTGDNKILYVKGRVYALLAKNDGGIWTLNMYVNSSIKSEDFVAIPLAPAFGPRPDLDYVYSLFLLRYEGEL